MAAAAGSCLDGAVRCAAVAEPVAARKSCDEPLE